MNSPFPGMDPYLEDPVRWAGVHQSLITFARGALNETLPEDYVADIGERVYPLDAAPAEVREVFVRILPAGEADRVVAVIEVLSPSNKAAGNPGRDLYLQKQMEILQSDTHLVEIDLLRRGEHTVAAPLYSLRSFGTWDYLVCRHLGRTGDRYEAWPIHLRDRLPVIRIPLDHGDPDVELDLRPLFDRAYAEGAYQRRLDYRQEPTVPLAPEDAAWADALLREKGLRP